MTKEENKERIARAVQSSQQSLQESMQQSEQQQQERNNEIKVRAINDLLGNPGGRIRWIADPTTSASRLRSLSTQEQAEAKAMIEEALALRHRFTGKAWRKDPFDYDKFIEEDWSWLFNTAGHPRNVHSFTPAGRDVYRHYREGLDRAFSQWEKEGAKPETQPAGRVLHADESVYITYFMVLDTIVGRWEGAGLPPLEKPIPYE